MVESNRIESKNRDVLLKIYQFVGRKVRTIKVFRARNITNTKNISFTDRKCQTPSRFQESVMILD